MKLTEHFDLEEMTVSQVAARRGMKNIPTPAQVAALTELCANVLEPLRKMVGKPIVVTSGFRSPNVNAAVGGSKTSDHLYGRAADIVIPGYTPLQVCKLIDDMNLPYKQLIHEFSEWTHVSIPPVNEQPKREKLTATHSPKGTVYMKGLF